MVSLTGIATEKNVTDAVATIEGSCKTATGFSTHSANDVVTALGTGSTLTSCKTATGFSVAGDKMDLIDAPNSKAVTAIQLGLSTFDSANDTVAKVALVDICTANSDMRGTDGAALASAWTATRAGYVDKLNVAGTLANTDNASSFMADVSGLATSKALETVDTIADDIKAVTVKIDTGLVADGLVYQFTANALELAPTGGSAPTVEQIRSEMDTNSIKLANLDAKVSDTSTLTTTDVENAVWDSKMADHLDADTTGYALSVAGSSSDPWITALPGVYKAGQAGYLIGRSLSGGGANVVTYTLSTGEFADVTVEVYSDAAYANLVATGVTDSFGSVTFYLDSGTYYLLRKKAGYDFENPDTEVVP
jgi:hypothetical protein